MREEKKNVLVTGATGFIGRTVCTRLLKEGFIVRGTLRRPERALMLPRGAEPIVAGDISRGSDWASALKGAHTVVHLAARVHRMRESDAEASEAYMQINREGTVRLAMAAAKAGVRRFVFLSTIKVNGEGSISPYTENDSPAPSGSYARSKWEAEQNLRDLAERFQMEWVVLRPPLVYGPGVGANFLKLIDSVYKGVPLPLGSVHNRRSLISASNLSDALFRAIIHSGAANKLFLVSDNETVSTPDLIRGIARSLGRTARLFPAPVLLLRMIGIFTGARELFDRLTGSLTIDANRIRKILEWAPPESIESGLASTCRWYLQRTAG